MPKEEEGGEQAYLHRKIDYMVVYCCHVDREVAVGFSALGPKRAEWGAGLVAAGY